MPDAPAAARTVLAFDVGRRRIGVAVGQTLTGTASPLTTCTCPGDAPDWPAIDELVRQWRPQALVVGLPLRESGEESQSTATARAFAGELEQRFALPVALHDERLSSAEARGLIREQRRSGARRRRSRKEDVDKLAAAVILQSWLNEHPILTQRREDAE